MLLRPVLMNVNLTIQFYTFSLPALSSLELGSLSYSALGEVIASQINQIFYTLCCYQSNLLNNFRSMVVLEELNLSILLGVCFVEH